MYIFQSNAEMFPDKQNVHLLVKRTVDGSVSQ